MGARGGSARLGRVEEVVRVVNTNYRTPPRPLKTGIERESEKTGGVSYVRRKVGGGGRISRCVYVFVRVGWRGGGDVNMSDPL